MNRLIETLVEALKPISTEHAWETAGKIPALKKFQAREVIIWQILWSTNNVQALYEVLDIKDEPDIVAAFNKYDFLWEKIKQIYLGEKKSKSK